MKSRLSLKNLAKSGLLLNLAIISGIIYGCSSSTAPTYRKEDVPHAIQDICKNEYKIDVKARMFGETLWIYLAVEDMFVKSDKPEKYLEKFEIENNTADFTGDALKINYLVKPVPEKEKLQEYKYNKEVVEKNHNVWKSLRRAIFSMDRSKESEPKFFCLVMADIKNGFESKEIFYYQDLKKVSYEFISWTEYQHRSVSEMDVSPAIIQDTEGEHLDYSDITMQEFLARQIQQRIKLKFQKPEVEKNADIDKEVLKIVAYTFKVYGFNDFSSVELNNLSTNNRIVLNQAALFARPIE